MQRRRFLLGVGALAGLAGCGGTAKKPTPIDRDVPDPDETATPAPKTFEFEPEEPVTGTLYEGTVDGQRYVRGPFGGGQPVVVETRSVAGSLVAELVIGRPAARAHVYRPRTATVRALRRTNYLVLRTEGGPAEITVTARDERQPLDATGVLLDREIEHTRSVITGPDTSSAEVSVTGLDDGEKLIVSYGSPQYASWDDARIQFYEDSTRTVDSTSGDIFRLVPRRTKAPFDAPVEVSVTVTARTSSDGRD